MGDVSSRLIETLQSVDLIVAEDTRVSKRLCDVFMIKTPVICLNAHNENQQSKSLIVRLQAGENIAIVSDAGTPGISDPGAHFISDCVSAGILVIPIAGPSAVSTLLSASGFVADHYIFAGFFPRKENEALDLLGSFSQNWPLVFFESPKRLMKTLEFFDRHFPQASCVFGKELTKKFETIFYGSPSVVLTQVQTKLVKGEWCFAVRLNKIKEDTVNVRVVQQLKELGLSQKDIISVCKELGWSKNQVYDLSLNKEEKR